MSASAAPRRASAPAKVSIDVTVEAGEWLPRRTLRALARRAVDSGLAEAGTTGRSELGIVFTGDAEVQALNAAWRGKDKPTNVLSFPAMPDFAGAGLPPLLGDVVLAEETVRREAELEGKPLEHHIAHLIVHGLLHLLGHDHEEEAEAEAMEALERRALARLAIADPYA